MFRNDYCFVLTLAIAVLASTISTTIVNSAEKPNILFIFADDQNYKTLSCYDGAPNWVSTPNIDALARSGIRFHRSYLGAWCMPSRASLLTGRLQHAVPTMRMEGKYPASTYDPAQCRFWPSVLRQSGYHTAQIGKWHTGTDTGFGRDWDHQIVWNRPGRPDNAGNYFYDQMLTFNGVDRLTKGYSTDNYTDWAVEYIQGKNRDPSKPWYLWLCYGAIHGPTTPAERHRGKLAGHKAPLPQDIFGPWPDKPAYVTENSAWLLGQDGAAYRKKREVAASNFDKNDAGQAYDDWVQQSNECAMAIDEGVGRLMAALRESGQLENTLVIYAADQGFALGEHGGNHKLAPYDANISSPLILSFEGHLAAGKVCRHPINAPDLVNYLAETSGITIPWKTDGRNIRKLLETPETTDWNSPMLMTHTGRCYGDDTAAFPSQEKLLDTNNVPWYVLLRDQQYKYVRYWVAGETEELYDLDADPDELTNLAKQPLHRQRLLSLRAKTLAELQRTDAKFIDILPPVTE